MKHNHTHASAMSRSSMAQKFRTCPARSSNPFPGPHFSPPVQLTQILVPFIRSLDPANDSILVVPRSPFDCREPSDRILQASLRHLTAPVQSQSIPLRRLTLASSPEPDVPSRLPQDPSRSGQSLPYHDHIAFGHGVQHLLTYLTLAPVLFI